MTSEQQAAYVFAQAVCALTECAGMMAENQGRLSRGETIAYDDEAFLNLQQKYGIHHNALMNWLTP